MLKTYYCHCRGPPKCPSSCSSSHAFMTGAMRAMRSAACCRILADLLLRRHLIVPHTCVRGGRGAPSSRVWGTHHVEHGDAGAFDMPGVSALAHARGQAHTSLRGGRVGGVPCWSHVLPPEAVPCQCRFSMRAHKWLGLLRAGCRVPVGGECCWVHFSSFLSML